MLTTSILLKMVKLPQAMTNSDVIAVYHSVAEGSEVMCLCCSSFCFLLESLVLFAQSLSECKKMKLNKG